MPASSPPSGTDMEGLKELAKRALRSSYEVMANNFASPELMDIFITSVVLIPYRR
jgi:hypothetical protein